MIRHLRARAVATRVTGALTITAYVLILVVLAADPAVHPRAFASSPAGVVSGNILPLLSSGLVVDGPRWPQIVALAATLVVAVRAVGAVRLWIVALLAHVGATVLAYVAVAWMWVVDPAAVRLVTHAPDYGISVVFAGELGTLTRLRRPRLVGLGVVGLAVAAAFPIAVEGTVTELGLAGVEHLLGFLLGTLACPEVRSERRSASAGQVLYGPGPCPIIGGRSSSRS